MLRESQKIANENHKNFNKIPQLIKVWEAIRICYEKQPFTYADLAKLTGLSYKQIRDVRRLLESNDAFKTSRAGSYFLNMGSNVELNGFFE
jgi:predicted transcriptional regulator